MFEGRRGELSTLDQGSRTGEMELVGVGLNRIDDSARVMAVGLKRQVGLI